MRLKRALFGLGFLLAPFAAQAAGTAGPLPPLNIDLAQTTVSGLSAGAYMAGQFHVAFSGEVRGAGLVAGGPYGCAEGSLLTALRRCMSTGLGDPDPAALFAAAEALAKAGAIDPLSNLADDRVYVFSGTSDRTVVPAVSARIAPFYALAGVPAAAIHVAADMAAGHGFITESGPVTCGDTAPPFVNGCKLDQAREILEFLHGPLQPAAATTTAPVAFDQTLYLRNPEPRGMATTGQVYIPAACAAGEACRVHIVFHGCLQNTETVEDAVTVGAGYNRWAETNHVVVLYPQAHASTTNPNACWDWWGYTGTGYATRHGAQMAAVQRMLLALAGRPAPSESETCAKHQAGNWTQWREGRAMLCGIGLCAAGSGDAIGSFIGTSTIYEEPQGFFTAEPCGG